MVFYILIFCLNVLILYSSRHFHFCLFPHYSHLPSTKITNISFIKIVYHELFLTIDKNQVFIRVGWKVLDGVGMSGSLYSGIGGSGYEEYTIKFLLEFYNAYYHCAIKFFCLRKPTNSFNILSVL